MDQFNIQFLSQHYERNIVFIIGNYTLNKENKRFKSFVIMDLLK